MAVLTIPPISGFNTWEPGSGRVQPRARGAGFFVPDELPNDGTSYLPFTVDWSIRLTELSTNIDLCLLSNRPVDKSMADSNGFTLYVDHNGYLFLYGSDGHNYDYTNHRPAIDTWHHLALVFDGTDLIYYLNGVETIRATPNSMALPTDPPGINDGYSYGLYFGEIANIRQWSKAMTETEVQEASTTDYPDGTADLISAYRMDSGQVYEPAAIGTQDAWIPDNLSLSDVTVAAAGDPRYSDFKLEPIPPVTVAVSPGAVPQEGEGSYAGQISGVVTVKGDPAAQRVMAFERKTGKKVAETASAEDGTYTLTGLNPEAAHYVVALDKNLEYNGVIADNIVPEVPA